MSERVTAAWDFRTLWFGCVAGGAVAAIGHLWLGPRRVRQGARD